MQPPEEGGSDKKAAGEGENGMNVYDFDGENEDLNADLELDDKSKIVKMGGRRSQTVAQSHMCNYCNYTTPKRYKENETYNS